MKIEYKLNKIIIDGKEIKTNEINSELLENIANSALKNELDLDIDSNMKDLPLGVLFSDIGKLSNPENDLRKKIREIEEQKEETEQLLQKHDDSCNE